MPGISVNLAFVEGTRKDQDVQVLALLISCSLLISFMLIACKPTGLPVEPDLPDTTSFVPGEARARLGRGASTLWRPPPLAISSPLAASSE
jgi:hypothetical protein